MVAGLALSLGTWFGPRLALGPQVVVSIVQQRDFVQSVVASGHVEAPHRVNVGTQMVGTVQRVPVSEGLQVVAGQVLIELDHTELQAIAAQADVAVQQAEARLRQLHEVQAPVAQAGLSEARITLTNAQAQWQRNADLFKQGFIGQAALDDAQKTVDLAQAQWHTAQIQFDTAQPRGSDSAIAAAALDLARASAQAAHARLGYATITAPVAGTLIARNVERGDVVQPGAALMVLSPSGTSELVTQIDEKNLHLLKLGLSAQASADAYPDQRFQAVVSYINPGVDVQRGSVEVKLAVPTPPDYLRQDMTVSVDIQVVTHRQALLLPLDAVHEADGSQPWVLKVVGHQAQRQAVRLGLRSAGLAEVLQGLTPGDLVVPTAVQQVHEGSHLRAVPHGAAP